MIFGLVNKNSGPGWHRVTMPLLMMPNTDVYITNAIQEEDFEKRKPKAIYYNRMISDEVLRLQSKYHFKVVVDIDDYWHLDPHHIMFRFAKEKNMTAHHIKHLRIADVVTTTHERLAEKVYEFNKNVIVVPNAIPNNEYFPTTRTISGDGQTRVFWQGSVTHEADIKLLARTVKKLDKDRFKMVMAGHTDQVEWDRMAGSFTDNERMPHVIFKGAPPHEYYRAYQYADIAVVPLLSTKFNQYKSCLKILEAAKMGIPVIASNVHPYKNIPGVAYVNKSEDWYRWITTPLDELNEMAKVLKDYCDKEYDFDTINKKRMEAFV